jgi:hypothetical protein
MTPKAGGCGGQMARSFRKWRCPARYAGAEVARHAKAVVPQAIYTFVIRTAAVRLR